MVPYRAGMRLTVHRVPFSTNVERIALAAAFKGIAIDWVDHDAADRGTLRERTGQDLVPVLEECDGTLITDSPIILARRETLVPTPALWPAAARERAVADLFVAWFNRVWKHAPNALADGGPPDPTDAPVLAAELAASRDVFEALLTGRDHLLSDGFGIADVVAFPFLQYAVHLAPEDPDDFHRVLHEGLRLGDGYPGLKAWIARVDARPRA